MTNHDKAQHFVFRPTEPGGIDNEIFSENMDEIRKRLNLMSLCLEKLDPELQKLGFDPVRNMSVTEKLRIANLVTAIIDAFFPPRK